MPLPPKVKISIERIARLRVAGVRDGQIADIVKLTRSGLSRIIALDEYKDTEMAILTGNTTKMDEELAGQVEKMRAQFKVAVPAAMRAMMDNVLQKRDLRARMEAAKEIMDRDPEGTFAKNPTGQNRGVDPFIGIPDGILKTVREDADVVADSLKNTKVKTFIQ